jgi:phosphoglycolate phosphatase-like HAD superfamily hydrolase
MVSLTLFKGKVELSPRLVPRPEISHVLFDFDGTLSLIRQGWQEVMLAMFAEMLPRRTDETESSSRQLLDDDIARLTGKQTIYQMIQFAERVQERGGRPREPLWYKQEYLRRLHDRIRHRIEGLRAATLDRERYLVFGARALLENLAGRRLTLYLASGTDEPFVKQEAELLGITHYFGPRIYGAQDNYQQFSKKKVIARILHENCVPGKQLLTFGDGFVEIENTKAVGGLAIAVASDEAHNGSGQMDAWKRRRLCDIGADVVIPDFRDAAVLMDYILNHAQKFPSASQKCNPSSNQLKQL